jgi:hypothetical protein
MRRALVVCPVIVKTPLGRAFLRVHGGQIREAMVLHQGGIGWQQPRPMYRCMLCISTSGASEWEAQGERSQTCPMFWASCDNHITVSACIYPGARGPNHRESKPFCSFPHVLPHTHYYPGPLMHLIHSPGICCGSDHHPMSPETLCSFSQPPTLARVVHDLCNFDERRSTPPKKEAPRGTKRPWYIILDPEAPNMFTKHVLR